MLSLKTYTTCKFVWQLLKNKILLIHLQCTWLLLCLQFERFGCGFGGVLGLPELIFSITACMALCFGSGTKAGLVTHQCLAIAKQCLHSGKAFSFFQCASSVNRLGVGKKLGGDTTWAADSKWPGGYSKPGLWGGGYCSETGWALVFLREVVSDGLCNTCLGFFFVPNSFTY